ncbi:MAG: Low molecular weight phosphotyrosine protein phosphatase [Candidatus Magnetoglobus multicellularis str. Araruama]|uniref:Low molecular weight phosphotyrosine protein phosphatase n=1 Tax=Candidatus Magnetoglobus multicellularis str. Araruama TaxID=890399 RepID=A0A1V1PIT1_9BACT|nr:MAG: Low molecular weight phosphotyrosine protein phosphatase [Candidatus Magnetoglobus multicellularis str. Araruama]
MIDRTQTFWARKYRLNMEDPRRKIRKGFLLAVGATKGKNLFNGTMATAKYFFDAIGASGIGELTYRKIEDRGDIEAHPTAISEAQQKAEEIVSPVLQRKKILFACRENACRSQMAAAFANYYAGDVIEAVCGGSQPIESVNADMEQVMKETGLDMGFIRPQTIDKALEYVQPDVIVTMGCGEDGCPFVPGSRRMDWDLPDPSGQPVDTMRQIRDDILQRVQVLKETLKQ